MITVAVLTGLVLAAFAALAGGTWLAGRPELRRSSGAHSARALRQSRDDATVSWLRSMRAARRVPPLAIAWTQVTALAAAIARYKAGVPVQDVHLPAFDITEDEFAAARTLVVQRYGAVPPSLQAVVDKGGRFGLPAPSPAELPAGTRSGLWQAAQMPDGQLLPGRPDVDNLDDTGALPKFIDWATNAPLSEVTSA